jgi:hypothetical protein
MGFSIKTLAVAAVLATAGGAAYAAEAMGCCAKCACCKEMKGDKPGQGQHQGGHKDHQPDQPKS